MQRLDTVSRHGLISSVRHEDVLWFDPQELITDDVRQLAKAHRAELIAEIRASAGASESPARELLPAYRFLWVATTLESFEESDPRYGYEIGRDPVFRMFDAPYYAWLRHHMGNASKAHNDGRLIDDEYAVLRDRFNVIHTWAISHIGEDALRRAMRTTNIKRYVIPCNATIETYHRSWDASREDNKARRRAMVALASSDRRTMRLAQLLATQGYAVIRSSVLDTPVVIVQDGRAVVPTRWTDTVTFTMDELSLMVGASPEAVRQICDIKDIIGGRVVGDDEIMPVEQDKPRTTRQAAMPRRVPAAQHSLFGSPGGA